MGEGAFQLLCWPWKTKPSSSGRPPRTKVKVLESVVFAGHLVEERGRPEGDTSEFRGRANRIGEDPPAAFDDKQMRGLDRGLPSCAPWL